MAMPDLIASTRPSQARRHGLASGFTPPAAIAPASTAGGTQPVAARASATADRLVTATRPGTTSRLNRTASGPLGESVGRTTPGSPPLRPGTVAAGASGIAASQGHASQAGRRPALENVGSSGELVLHRRYLPAPPPISVRQPSGAPPVPAAARLSAPTAARATVAATARTIAPSAALASRAALQTAAADLFRYANPGQSVTTRFDDAPGGSSVSTSPGGPGYGGPAVGSGFTADLSRFPEPVEPPAIPDREMERIVEKVVEKLEERVIDELERRGRRHNPGVF
jgi:hypothetical protein